jgi:uncharacterized membrane protein
MMETDNTYNPERKIILQVYAVFGAGLVLSLLPFLMAASLSFLLVLGALIAAYIIRGNAPDASLTENHMTYIIRTIWIGSLVALVTIAAASLYLFQSLDNTPLDPCIEKFYNMGLSGQAATMQMTVMAFQGCFVSYMTVNMGAFLIAGAIGAVPVLIYFGVRYIRGITRALKSYRIARPDAWL